MVQPIGPLMIEHRLIEQIIPIIDEKTAEIRDTGVADVKFIDTAVDFIRTYADRCHHGKEEQILFRELKKKQMSKKDTKIMKELVAEHVRGRQLTRSLLEAKERYLSGNKKALSDILDLLTELAKFYPKHIEKEDKGFFKPAMAYFSEAERNAMLDEMYDFDRQFVHNIYKNIILELKEAK
jgi:hemerythrin-like domain-containing protein